MGWRAEHLRGGLWVEVDPHPAFPLKGEGLSRAWLGKGGGIGMQLNQERKPLPLFGSLIRGCCASGTTETNVVELVYRII